MAKYILKRLAYMLVVFTIIAALMFFLYNLIPGDPARAEVEALKSTLKPEQYEQMYQEARARLGLDQPMVVRFFKWYFGIWTGHFGFSNYYKANVIDIVKEPMMNTLFINIFSTFLALGCTIPLGIYCAVHQQSKFDQGVQVGTIVGYSIPGYIIARIFIYIFSVTLRWFPVSGSKAPGSSLTGFPALMERLYYICLPLIVMTFSALGGMTRYVRAAMIDALSMDYIRTARAKGLREKVVIYSHAWRNALLPVITLIIGWFLGIFSGSIIIENTFNLNGMGQLYYKGLTNQDYELVLAMQMFYTAVSLVGALLIDLSYGLVDPRVRVNK